jgi:hypothetical protein
LCNNLRRYSKPDTDFRIKGIEVFMQLIGKPYQKTMCDAVREVINAGLKNEEDLSQCAARWPLSLSPCADYFLLQVL